MIAPNQPTGSMSLNKAQPLWASPGGIVFIRVKSNTQIIKKGSEIMKKQQKFYQIRIKFLRLDLDDGYLYVTCYRIPIKHRTKAITKALKLFNKQTKKKNFMIVEANIDKEINYDIKPYHHR